MGQGRHTGLEKGFPSYTTGGTTMPRRLSDDTIYILWWLWYLPWASAADIARITGLNQVGMDPVTAI